MEPIFLSLPYFEEEIENINKVMAASLALDMEIHLAMMEKLIPDPNTLELTKKKLASGIVL